MKKISLFAATLSAVALLTGCSSTPAGVPASMNVGSVEDVYAEALAYAQTQHPGAVLVGYNNGGLTFDRINVVPDQRDVSGETNYWTYIFVQDQEDLSDSVVGEDEAFAVEFFDGNLTYAGYVQTRDRSIDETTLTGEELFAIDTPEILEAFLVEVEKLAGERPEAYHVNFNAAAGTYELSYFTAEDAGWSGMVDVTTGEIYNVQPFSISVF